MNDAVEYSRCKTAAERVCFSRSFPDLDISVARKDIADGRSGRVNNRSRRSSKGYIKRVSLACRNRHVYRNRNCRCKSRVVRDNSRVGSDQGPSAGIGLEPDMRSGFVINGHIVVAVEILIKRVDYDFVNGGNIEHVSVITCSAGERCRESSRRTCQRRCVSRDRRGAETKQFLYRIGKRKMRMNSGGEHG